MADSLKQRITADMIVAMKQKQAERLGFIRFLLAAIKQKEIDERLTDIADTQVIGVIEKQLKQCRESHKQYADAGRTDLASKEQAQIDFLLGYLPEKMTEQETTAAVQAIMNHLGASADMAKVMAAAKQQLAGKADFSMVSSIVKKLLQAH